MAEKNAARHRSDTRHLVGASIVVTALGLVTKLIGLATQSVVAAIFGATRAMDAYRVVLNVPQMFSTWVRQPVRAAIVPLFTRIREEKGEKAAWEAASNILNCLTAGLLLLVAVLYLGSGLVARVMASGFRDPDVWSEMSRYIQLIVVSIVFSVLAVVLGSLHNIYRRQQYPALGRLANGLAVLVGVGFFGPRFGFTGYVGGIVTGAVMAFLVQAILFWPHRQLYTFVFRPRAPEIRELLALALPLFVGLTGTRIDVFLDQNFASWLPAGHLAALTFAVFLSAVATDLLITVSSTVLLPHFAELVSQRRFDELRERLAQSLGGYLLLLLPVASFLIVGAYAVVELVYLRGNFTQEKAELTAMLLPILALGAPAFSMGQVLAQVHISGGDTRTPMAVGFWRVGFKAVVSVALLVSLPLPYKIAGLAAASTASSFFRTALLWRRLDPARRPAGAPFVRMAGALVISASLGGLAGWFALSWMPGAGGGFVRVAIRVVSASAVTMAVHLVVASLLSPPLRRTVRRLLRR